MGFWSVANLRTILTGETDADSPGSEELASQLRENHEALTLLTYATGSTGSVTTIGGASSSTLNDSSAAYSSDQHNSRTLLITGTSGSATGNTYTITDTTATTLVCGSEDLAADGVAASDSYIILYDLTNTSGHDHDGINSKAVQSVASGAIDEDKLDGIYRCVYSAGSASNNDTTWDQDDYFRIYITAGQDVMRVVAKGADGGASATELKITVSGTSITLTQSNNTPTWKSGTVSISHLSGWYEVTIESRITGGSGTGSWGGITIYTY